LVDDGACEQAGTQVGEAGTVREVTEPQEVSNFLEGRVAGEVVDLVAAVDQAALLAHDFADTRLCGDDAFQPLGRHPDSIFRLGRSLDSLLAPGWQAAGTGQRQAPLRLAARRAPAGAPNIAGAPEGGQVRAHACIM